MFFYHCRSGRWRGKNAILIFLCSGCLIKRNKFEIHFDLLLAVTGLCDVFMANTRDNDIGLVSTQVG
jgi:hypothetical protein